MEDFLLYAGATLALRYARLGIFGRPERRLQQQVCYFTDIEPLRDSLFTLGVACHLAFHKRIYLSAHAVQVCAAGTEATYAERAQELVNCGVP